MNELKMTEIETLSWFELERVVNDLKKNHTKKGLTDLETKILKGIFEDKKYADLAEEISREEQSIKNAAYSLFKILSEQTGEKIGSKNLITALSRWKLQPECNQKNTNHDGKFSGAVVFTASENKKKQILTLLELLRKITDDQEITITDVEQGSIKLTLKGSQKSLEKIESLFKSGELNKISGDITVENVQFTEDNCLAFTISGDVNADEITYLKSTIIGQNLAESPKQLAEESSANPLIVKTVSINEASKEINNKLIESIKKPNFLQRIIRRFRRINLRGANLSDADLSGANLRGANLIGADLIAANLIGANLSDANLSGANLSGANLIKANLIGANLSGANLSDADLRGANLIGANLSGANLSDADLRGAILSGADLIGADLRGAILSVADLIGAILSVADLIGADLRGANLSEADLSWAILRGANLRGANVKKAIFIDATGITPEQKQVLIRRGAIFGDTSNDRSKALV
ncbi:MULTISPECIES: pentapeptide repeat-containing protein [unclassified Microcystis]|uniref:pentapeptide repeat-containing protein n=2 Tax=unclassified Microcystis TaxID=2643300 RepID=UPI00338D66C0